MVRHLYSTEFVQLAGTALPAPFLPFRIWTDLFGGTDVTAQIVGTDGVSAYSSVDLSGNPITDSQGNIPPFRGPDGYVGNLFADTGAAYRFYLDSPTLIDYLISNVGVGGGGGVTDHGALSGLLDDDHPQYHTDARGDLRYYLKAQTDSAISSAISTSSTADRNRANHSGTQLASSISDFQSAVQATPGFGSGGSGGISPGGTPAALQVPYRNSSNSLVWTAATAVVARALGWTIANDYAATPGNQPNKTELTNAIAAVRPNGTLFLEGAYSWTGDIVVTTQGITITGPSAVINGRFKFGDGTARNQMGACVQHTNFYTAPNTTAYPQKGYAEGSYFIGVDRARDVEITGCHFTGAAWPIYAMPNASCASHDISSLNVHDNFFSECDYAFYSTYDAAAPGGWQCLADTAFNNNIINVAYISHFYAQGVDGVNINNNPSWFMLNYKSGNARWSEKRQNIRIDQSDWVHINNNALFEAGDESVLLDKARNVEMCGNQFAWPGQRVPASAVKVVSNSGGAYASGPYASLSFVGNQGIYYSKSLLECVGDFSGLALGPNTCLYSTSVPSGDVYPGRYRGTTETNATQRTATMNATEHHRYDLFNVTNLLASRMSITDQTLSQTDSGNTVNTYIYSDKLPLHPLTSSITTLAPYSAISGAVIPSLSFTANTEQSVIQLRGVENNFSTYSGQVTVTARDSTTNQESTYVLHVAKTKDSDYQVNVISALGYPSGTTGDDPSFTWKLESNGLRALPIGSTSGAFFFSFATLGNLIVG